jgi:hypothetical protein
MVVISTHAELALDGAQRLDLDLFARQPDHGPAAAP